MPIMHMPVLILHVELEKILSGHDNPFMMHLLITSWADNTSDNYKPYKLMVVWAALLVTTFQSPILGIARPNLKEGYGACSKDFPKDINYGLFLWERGFSIVAG